MNHALSLEGVSYTYPDGTGALEGITLCIEHGERVALVGPSGAGKTTIAKCLLGFLFPQKGTIHINGIQVNKKNLNRVREEIGFIFQDPDDQLFMPTVFEDVAFGLVQRGIKNEELESRVAKALEDRGMEELSGKFPGHLSGGEKRLAALAGVLVMDPKVLVMDEPGSNLDPRARRNLIRQLAGLENTCILAGHDLEMVLDLCSRAVLLNSGKIIRSGAPEQILGDRELMEANGLEKPHSLVPHAEGHHRT